MNSIRPPRWSAPGKTVSPRPLFLVMKIQPVTAEPKKDAAVAEKDVPKSPLRPINNALF